MSDSVIRIRPGQALRGIRFWRQDLPNCLPRFEVMEYVGYDPDKGLHFFRSVKNKSLISKGNHQLDVNGFHPFLISGGTHAAA